MSICLLIMLDTLLLRLSLHCNTSLHFATLHPTAQLKVSRRNHYRCLFLTTHKNLYNCLSNNSYRWRTRKATLPSLIPVLNVQQIYCIVLLLDLRFKEVTSKVLIFIAASWILKSIVHSPTNAIFIKLGKVLKFTLKFTQISLLHVSVLDRHQGACTEPG
jgi:hypothetical protein